MYGILPIHPQYEIIHLSHTAIGPDVLAINPRRVRTRQERNNIRNLLRCPDPIHGVEPCNHLDDRLGLAVVEEISSGRAGGDSVDSDGALAKVLGEDPSNLFDSTLGRIVEEVVRGDSGSGSEGSREENNATTIRDMWYSSLGGEMLVCLKADMFEVGY